MKTYLAAFMATGILIVAALAGCPAAVPGVSCVAEVLADALKGMTVAEILSDAGPGCVKDAAEIVTILLGSEDPRVHETKAYKESLAARGHQ